MLGCTLCSFGIANVKADAVCTLPSEGWSETVEDGETVYTRLATHGTVVTVERSEGDDCITSDFRINTYDSSWYSPVRFIYTVGGSEFICGFDIFDGTITVKNGDTLLKSAAYSFETGKWYSVKIVEGEEAVTIYLNDFENAALSVTGISGFSGKRELTLGGSNVNASFRKVVSGKVPAKKDVIVMPANGWNKTEDNGNVVISRLATHDAEVLLTEIGNANILDFEMRITQFDSSWYSPAVIGYKTSSGSVSMQYDKFLNSLALYSGENKLVSESLDLSLNEWYRFRFVFDKNCLEIYTFDGENPVKLTSSRSTGSMKFGTGNVYFYGSNVKVDFKNPVSSRTETESVRDNLDLDFSSSDSVEGYVGKGATISYDGGLKIALEEPNGGVYSPMYEAARGTYSSAYLPVMNTIVAKIKNNSSADKIKVYFITSEDKKIDEEKTAEFEIQPNSEGTYYFNLSVNQSATGYLRGFGFAFNAEGGEVIVEKIRFSAETPYYDYAGKVTACVANGDKITVTGELPTSFDGKTVTVYETPVMNYTENLSFDGVTALGSGKVSGGKFTVTFPLKGDAVSRLAAYFLAAVDGRKVSKRFLVSNYDDFANNPYEFTLSDATIDVTEAPYFAKGDGFTDDTEAIQAAIDYASSSGGGKVVLPRGDGEYGKRYVSTGVVMKSNTELCIEEGAVLWQSAKLSDYKGKVYLGHTNMGKDIAWGLSALMHLPFVYIHNVENVKVTGGGEIRMSDNGSESMDGNGCVIDGVYYSDGAYTIGCASNVHMIPIAVYGGKNVELSKITIRRANNWHIYVREASRVYIRDVFEENANCLNADGIDFSTSVHDVVMERFINYTNDDALALCICTNDPRDDVSVWRKRSVSDDRSLYNFAIRDCNIYGGHGLTFIPWASDFSDASKAEIRDINVTNCYLNGAWNAVGSWSDNPFYGTSNYYLGTYGFAEAAEDDDYSPVRDVTIIGNVYGNWSTLNGIKATNFVTDCEIDGAHDLQNADFDKKVKFEGEENFVTGTSYWSRTGVVGTEKRFGGYGYSAFISGKGTLSQGVFRIGGEHSFKFDYMSESGTAKAVVKNLLTGEIIAEKTLGNVSDITEEELKFTVLRNMQVFVGFEYDGADGEKMYIDNAELILEKSTAYIVEGTELFIGFDFDEEYPSNFGNYSVKEGVSVEDGRLKVDKETEYKLILKNVTVTNMSLSVKIYPSVSSGEINSGVLVNTKGTLSSGFITSLNVQVEKAAGAENYLVSVYSFDSQKGYLGKVAVSGNCKYNGEYVSLKTVIKDGWLYVFADDGDMPVISYETGDAVGGGVGLRTWLCDTYFDDFTLIAKELAPKPGNRTKLDALIAFAETIDANDYTKETYDALVSAAEEAKNLSSEAVQKEVNAAYNALYNAVIALRKTEIVDRTKLDALISLAEKFAEQKAYTEESSGALKNAIESAKNLGVNADMTAVEDEYEKLIAALEGLEVKTEDSSNSGSSSCSSSMSCVGLAGVLSIAFASFAVKRKR